MEILNLLAVIAVFAAVMSPFVLVLYGLPRWLRWHRERRLRHYKENPDPLFGSFPDETLTREAGEDD